MAEVKPDAVVFAFDVHAPTFRHKMYGEYKAGRHPTPKELLDQFPVIKELLRDLGYPVIETEGWEADDILGTISRLCEEQGGECFISTGDRDSLQLIGPHTKVRLASTKMGASVSEMMDEDAVMQKYGVTPKELIQVKALMGDSSDNIPGVPGIGEKTALDLIGRYHSVDYIYEHLGEIEAKPSVLKNLEAGKDSAMLSLRLGKIDRFAPISENLEDYRKAPQRFPKYSRSGQKSAAKSPWKRRTAPFWQSLLIFRRQTCFLKPRATTFCPPRLSQMIKYIFFKTTDFSLIPPSALFLLRLPKNARMI